MAVTATKLFETSAGASSTGGGIRIVAYSAVMSAGGPGAVSGDIATPLSIVKAVSVGLDGTTPGSTFPSANDSAGTVTIYGDGGATYNVVIYGY